MGKEEIKVGEYIRTKGGDIKKVLSIRKEYKFTTGSGHTSYTPERYMFDSFKHPYSLSKPYVLKHSKNIIDLIEEGDYVNGGKVVEHAHEKGRLFVTCTYVGGKGFTTFEDYSWELTKDKEENIETIVTKEQFKEMEYKV